MDEKEVYARDPIIRQNKRAKPDRHPETGSRADELFESDWEVFVVRRDAATGEFVTHTARDVS